MKVKTALVLSEELLKAINRQYGKQRDISEFIEAAAWAFISEIIRNKQPSNDMEIINSRSDYLNEEASDVLAYQVKL